MPRKPKPPEYFVIEGLSTGIVRASVVAVDDFTGEPIEPKLPQAHKGRALPPVQGMINAQQRKAAQVQAAKTQRLAQALTKVITRMIDPPEHKPFKRRF